jgi:hypothetical protein
MNQRYFLASLKTVSAWRPLVSRFTPHLVCFVAIAPLAEVRAATTNAIVLENLKTGTSPNTWDISGAGDTSIQGFATQISVNKGQTVHFKISTSASAYRIDIYRLGYYQGNGARLVASTNPTASLPQNQPGPSTDSSTGLMDYGTWAESGSWQVPSNAVSGVYIAEPVRTDTSGMSHIPFIVRDDTNTSAMLFKTSDTTWQAYNDYGGNSLYVGNPAGRAYKVSYNRPFNTRGDSSYDWVFNAEYPMIRWLEANGYDVTYTTSVDADMRGPLMLQHQLVMSVGHDEYWSGGERTNFETAVGAGVHLGFFSGNEIFWKTRWESSIDGSSTPYRTLVTYKETTAGAKIDPAPVWTGTWRDPRFSPPYDGGRPENRLTGQIFFVNGPVSPPNSIQVPTAYRALRFWRNTSVATESSTTTFPAGTLGYEWDESPDNGFRPPGLVFMSSATWSGVPVLQDYGSTYATGTATHNLSLYRHPSGALVFGGGTVQWSWGLDSNHDNGSLAASTPMKQATVNLFADMGIQPGSIQSGLTAATASTDHTAPTSTITSPTPGTTIPLGNQITISGTASDTGGGVVGGVEVSTDNGSTWHPATGLTSWTYSWTVTQMGSTTIRSRAVDDSANLETPSSGVPVNMGTNIGSWSSVLPWHGVAVHSQLLKTGKVLTWQAGSNASVWDPAAGTFTNVPDPFATLLSPGNTFLPNGQLITLGGWNQTNGQGVTEVDLFDPVALTWSRATPMTYPRWYPTATVLPNGRVLATSGDAVTNSISAIPEIYDPIGNTWTALPQAFNSIPIYPFMYVRPDGRLVSVGNSEQAWDTEPLDLSIPAWSVLDNRVIDGGSVVMFQPGKFMKAGSASAPGNPGSSVATAFVLDLTQVNPAWRPTASMANPRSFHNLTMLPDGSVLSTGGGTDKAGTNTNNAVFAAELWSPSNETWSTMASMVTPRLYHSTAQLLPDGRVLVAGGGAQPGVADQPTAEIFSPPYLSKGSRPTITAVPSTLSYGSNFTVTTPSAATISSVSLISLGAVTHSFNQNQRFLNLNFQASAGSLTLSAPADSNLAPPGYYMLFLVNNNGVPSVGSFVNFAVPNAPLQVLVPSVVTLTQSAANTTISAADLSVGITVSTPSTLVPAGSVISQSPNAGAQAPAGSGVDLVLSSGLPTVNVAVDKVVSVDGHGTQVTSQFSTSSAGELLVAFGASDGPTSSQSLTVSGAGLTWSLVKRANAQFGTAEIWQARAANQLSNVTVTSTQQLGGYDQSLTVVAFTGASGVGASATAGAPNGGPSVSVTTTKSSSVVYGVGNDYDTATSRIVGPNQTMVHQWVDSGTGDTFWVQDESNPVPTAGTQAPINDSSPTLDQWNLAEVELMPALAPYINSFTATMAAHQLVLRGTGATNASWALLMATNFAQPLSTWTPVTNGSFNGSGQFVFTNGISPAAPAQFFRLRTP